MRIDDRVWQALTGSLLSGAGGDERPVQAGANPREFVALHDLLLDRTPFDLSEESGYSHLREIMEDTHPYLTLMMGAQGGKTGIALARTGWLMVALWGSMFGWYFPTNDLTRDFSNARFAPFFRGSPVLRPWVGRDTVDGRGQDAVRTRTIGPSRIFFLGADGKTSTESMPFRAVTLDEVRRMSYHHVQLIEERLSGQKDPRMTRVSTAFHPNNDIHAYFLRGDQRYFHSACRCPDGCVLSRLGPECILDLRSATPEIVAKARHAFQRAGRPYLGIEPQDEVRYARWHAAYYCPRCGEIIANPRDGWWEPDKPSHWEHSYQAGQVLSPRFPAARMLEKIARTDEPVNMQEVWNSGFGLPWVDPTRQPVTEADLRASVVPDAVWGALLERRARHELYPVVSLGCDVQAGYLVVVVKARVEGGRNRTVHLAILHGEDLWRQLARLMVEWKVRAAVVDAQPEANEARDFVSSFPGRAWMAYYTERDTAGPMIAWGDVSKERKQRGEERLRHVVTINRTVALDWSLSRWRAGLNETPPERGLLQSLPVDGEGRPILSAWLRGSTWAPVPLCRDLYWRHLQAIAFEDLVEELAGDARVRAERLGRGVQRRAVHVGIDPHFAHANLYADAGLSRIAPRTGHAEPSSG